MVHRIPKNWLNIPFHLILVTCSSGQAPTSAPAAEQEPPTRVPLKEEDSRQLSDHLATTYMYDLSGRDRALGSAALERVLEARDRRFIPVLLEVMRGIEVRMFLGTDYETTISALETLSGEIFGANWSAWVEWYGTTDLSPPVGFTGWKGEVLSFIDPRFADFLQEDASSEIRVEEIQWGGVSVDGISALDSAPKVPVGQADYLLPGEPVFGVAINGDARAYPLRIMDWHEIANDVVGGLPISLAYCTLCGAGIAFDGRASNGQTYGDYFSSTSTMFPVWQRSEQLETKDRIYALRIDGTPKAYPLNDVLLEGVVNDQIGESNVVLVANRGQVMVRGENLRVGQVLYDSGGEVRVFERGVETSLGRVEQ